MSTSFGVFCLSNDVSFVGIDGRISFVSKTNNGIFREVREGKEVSFV